ncbi:hypothetical protein LCGC14_1596100, partial [marine sediment metagenome]
MCISVGIVHPQERTGQATCPTSKAIVAGASPAHDQTDPANLADHQRDVDWDGLTDYVLHFLTGLMGISEGDTEACLTGQTFGGIPIEGCDAVRIVPPWLDSDGDGFGEPPLAKLRADRERNPRRRRVLGVLIPVVETIVRQPWHVEQPHTGPDAPSETVAVFATRRTVETRAYVGEILKRAPDVLIVQQPCPGLVDAIEAGDVLPQSIAVLERVRLLEYPDANVRRRAHELLERAGDSPDEVQRRLAAYLAAVAAASGTNGGDAIAGREVFIAQCAKCHRAGQDKDAIGHEVGPPLSSTINRSDEAIITN